MNHEERKKRRQLMAEMYAKLAPSEPQAIKEVARRFNVTVATVYTACSENNVAIIKKSPHIDSENKPRRVDISPKTRRILELLKDPNVTHLEIAKQVGCTHQNVSSIYNRYILLGYDLPSRDELYLARMSKREKVVKEKERQFIELYSTTGDLESAASQLGLPIKRAKTLIKHSKSAERRSQLRRRLLGMIADFLRGDMTGSEIARKWNVPAPKVFNVLAECRAAGIKIDLPNGREKQYRRLGITPQPE